MEAGGCARHLTHPKHMRPQACCFAAFSPLTVRCGFRAGQVTHPAGNSVRLCIPPAPPNSHPPDQQVPTDGVRYWLARLGGGFHARLAASGVLCSEATVHHIIARSARGIDHPLNYFLVDRGPNSAMGSRVEGFRGARCCFLLHRWPCLGPPLPAAPRARGSRRGEEGASSGVDPACPAGCRSSAIWTHRPAFASWLLYDGHQGLQPGLGLCWEAVVTTA